jgi:hypothetical protein
MYASALIFIIYKRNTIQNNDKYNTARQTKLQPNLNNDKYH